MERTKPIPCFICRNKVWMGTICVLAGIAGMTGLFLAVTTSDGAPFHVMLVWLWMIGVLASAGSLATGIASFWAHQRKAECFPVLPGQAARTTQRPGDD